MMRQNCEIAFLPQAPCRVFRIVKTTMIPVDAQEAEGHENGGLFISLEGYAREETFAELIVIRHRPFVPFVVETNVPIT
jgi:hypothetical protein